MLASGAAALMYQVLWARLLSLSIGSTSTSIAIVLSAFFLGLAVGAWFSERWASNSTDIKPYLVLEAIIGLAGLALLPILLNLDAVIAQSGAAQLDSVTNTNGLKFIIVMLLLAIPTTAIGATFPVMIRFLSYNSDDQQSSPLPGRQLSHFYALNTAGGVLGAILSGFVFIPLIGLDGSTYVAVGLNFAIVVVGLALINSLQTGSALATSSAAPVSPPARFIVDTATRNRALIVLFSTGMVALACEVAWTKYLAIYVHTTLYGFAAILAIFLTGLAAGAWAIKFWLDRLTRPALWVSAGLLALGISLLLTRVGLNALPELHTALTGTANSPVLSTGIKYSLVFALLFPATFIFGAIFTLNLRLASTPTDSLSHPVGRAYAINTLGGIVGALGAGLWIIPSFGTDIVLNFSATIPLLLALLFLYPPRLQVIPQGIRPALTAAIALAVGSNALLPPLDFHPMIKASSYYFDVNKNLDQPLIFLQEGTTGVISVVAQRPQQFMLQRDGLPEAVVNRQQAYLNLSETLLGLAPYLLHAPSQTTPRSAFIVGLGGATTTRALTTTDLKSIRVLELEPVVVDAVRAIFGAEIPALKDPRVELIIDDARQRLLLEDKTYDLIISQPSHPWLAGSAKMFSQEFFQIAGSRLATNGIYSQWLNLFNMDATTLRSILQAFYAEFDYGLNLVVVNESSLLMLGSHQPIRFDYARIEQRLTSPKLQAALAPHGIRQAQDLMRFFALSREEALQAAGDSPPNTDTNLLSEVRLASLSKMPTADEASFSLFWQYSRLDLTAYLEPQERAFRYEELANYFERWRDPQRAELAREQLRQISAPQKSEQLGEGS